MANSQKILREYLISLGYNIDDGSRKKFDTSVLKASTNVKGLALSVIGAGTALKYMIDSYARGMEKLYYSSIKANSSVSNLQAVNFAGAKIGIQDFAKTIEQLGMKLRGNPGYTAMLEMMGIKAAGRDTSETMTDIIKRFKDFAEPIQFQLADLFGITPEDFVLLAKFHDEYVAAMAQRKQMNADAGLDMDKAAEAARQYANMMRDVNAQFGILRDMLAIYLLPSFEKMAKYTSETLLGLSKLVGTGKMTPDLKNKINDGIDYLPATLQGGLRYMQWLKRGPKDTSNRRSSGTVTGEAPITPTGGQDTKAMFNALESQFGLPAGLLDAIYAKESNRGRALLSPAGAKGPFQFMDETAKGYGLTPMQSYDLGMASQAAAKLMQDLLKWAGGDLDKALAGYNWGQGNVDKYGLDKAPKETRDYVRAISGGEIGQTINVTVMSPDPQTAGDSVVRALTSPNSEVTRNLRSNLQ